MRIGMFAQVALVTVGYMTLVGESLAANLPRDETALVSSLERHSSQMSLAQLSAGQNDFYAQTGAFASGI